METYLVGGAVRDRLLGLPVVERDYVVVGATETEMREAGYRSVGRDFPVFLHPDTAEEYALARTERKVGPGHQGFECHASPDVTLEEDLMRRDLTVNAIAEDSQGNLVDPYRGRQDLSAGILRHVSAAFEEDPLRVLRVARFKAKLHGFAFEVAAETSALTKRMVEAGMLLELAPERILGELDKALTTAHPAEFFRYLNNIGAHGLLWPEIPHNSIDELMQRADIAGADVRFAFLLRNSDDEAIASLCKRLRCSNARTELSLMVAGHAETWARLPELDAEGVMTFLNSIDAIRRHDRFARFNDACDNIYSSVSLADAWLELCNSAAAVSARDVIEDAGELKGPELGKAINALRVERIAAMLETRR